MSCVILSFIFRSGSLSLRNLLSLFFQIYLENADAQIWMWQVHKKLVNEIIGPIFRENLKFWWDFETGIVDLFAASKYIPSKSV